MIRLIVKKMRITSLSLLDDNHLLDQNIFYQIRQGIRLSQNGKYLPIFFIFSGLTDFIFTSVYSLTFLLWLYIGISGILLFIIEEYLIRKYKKYTLNN